MVESPVRPRVEYKARKKRSALILTLVGLSVFLSIVSACLLLSLVLVGKHLVKTNITGCPLEQSRDVPITEFIDSSTTASISSTYINMTDVNVPKDLTFRLPRDVRPLLYDLKLHPDLNGDEFSGEVVINVTVEKTRSYVVLHTNQLNILSTSVTSENGTNVNIKKSYEYKKWQFWIIEFKSEISPGVYKIQLEFEGSLVKRIVGFYKSSYYDKAKEQRRYMATSKFEPTYARQAFPCFDEPAMKAPFKIRLVRPTTGYIALSNTDVINEVTDGALTTTEFRETVSMSTYLSCFIVCDFIAVEKTVNAGGIDGGQNFPFKVYATPAQTEKTKYALETGVAIIEYYIRYFNIAYPLPKLDMAAIPDFVSGAMEHWGLVTFRETSLLYDETISSTINLQRVGTVMAHELAHMWFGNLVTMAWWDELWLNEGFASYIEYKGTNAAEPEWQMMDQFIVSTLHPVLKVDATIATHPIVQTVSNPDQITEIFDTITYSKGASIIRMLEDFVGETVFQTAVTNYLIKHKYKNAKTSDLLEELKQIITDTNYDVEYVMATWTEQSGFPVVSVTKGSKDGDYILRQKRFYADPDNEGKDEPSKYNYLWYIPITFITDTTTVVQRAWFKNEDSVLTVTAPAGSKWIKFNNQQIGYYRVNYESSLWTDLITQLTTNPGVFEIADRAHLIEDAFSLAESTALDYGTALSITKYLSQEQEYVPWKVAASKLLKLNTLLRYTDIYSEYIEYGKKLVLDIYNKVGWNIGTLDDHLTKLLRTEIIQLACELGVEECLKEAGEQFTTWLTTNVKPHPDVRSLVYFYGMQSVGGVTEWEKVWKMFVDETDAQEKLKLMNGLSAIREPWILAKFLQLAQNEDNVRGQDYFTCLGYISSNPAGTSLVWNYVREYWLDLVDRFGLNERYLGRMIPTITNSFTLKVQLEEMNIFFEKYPDAGAGTAARKQALEDVSNNIKWLSVNKSAVEQWLKQQRLIAN